MGSQTLKTFASISIHFSVKRTEPSSSFSVLLEVLPFFLTINLEGGALQDSHSEGRSPALPSCGGYLATHRVWDDRIKNMSKQVRGPERAKTRTVNQGFARLERVVEQHSEV